MFRPLVCALLLVGWAGASIGESSGIEGAGASFPAPLYVSWASKYLQDTGRTVAYSATGSGAGIERIEREAVDFGATDAPLTHDELKRRGLVQFPVTIGGVVPVVNIAGVGPGVLRLTGPVLSEIFLGRIVRWNDPSIAALNPQLALPTSNITVVHRIDESGTTHLWSTYLAGSSAEWKARVGAASILRWPVGVAEVGNEGVASSVQRIRMSIGYVEFAYAMRHRLTYATLRNREGVFVRPGRTSFAAATFSAPWNQRTDLDQSLVDRPGAQSWPIVGASFILLQAHSQPQSRSLAVIDFFDWALRQGSAIADELDYVVMPDTATALIRELWLEQVEGLADRPSRMDRALP